MADKKAKKGKKKSKAPESEWPVISVSAHPRASRTVTRMKAWAGLLGFLLVGVLSYQAGVEPFEAVLRALIAGIALYLAAWAAGVAFWRSLVVEEARQEGERRRAEMEERLKAIKAAAENNGESTNGDEEAA